MFLEGVLQLDFLRHGHAVLGDGGRAPLFVQHHVAALGAQRDFDRFGKDFHALEQGLPGILAKLQFFSCHRIISFYLSDFELRLPPREGLGAPAPSFG
jgi:hypothetical protein